MFCRRDLMSDQVINVENLGKRYTLRHQAATTLFRDKIAQALRAPMRRFTRNAAAPNPREEEFWALRNVSFSVKRGDVVGIVGRNGAGKSTLLKVLSRITEPTTGRVRLRGRVASLLEVGTGFHPELSGRENIALNGAILGMTRAEIRKKFDEIVAFAEVERFIDTPVKHYSSGMYVRLAFAVAAHLEPEILIVDEVLAVGDAAFQKKSLGKMKSVAATEGRSVLFVSHQTEAVRALCSRCLWMAQGELVQDGLPAEVIPAYLENGVGGNFREMVGRGGSRLLDAGLAMEGEGLVFTAEFCTEEPLGEPKVGLVIRDADQRPVFGSNTQMHPMTVPLPRSDRHRIRLRVPVLPLHAGRYSVDFFLGDRADHLLSIEHVIFFEWSPTRAIMHRPAVRDIGPLHVPAYWETTPL
jgi:lipopolysaccharide transport system ATP-binding protein